MEMIAAKRIERAEYSESGEKKLKKEKKYIVGPLPTAWIHKWIRGL